MKGCRPLDSSERRAVLESAQDARARALFVLGVATGFRISELLSLRISGVIDEAGEPLKYVEVAGCHTKTGEGRTVALNPAAGRHLAEYAAHLRRQGAGLDAALFPSRQGGSVGCRQATRWIKALFAEAGVKGGKLSTHSMRKSYAAQMHRLLGYRLEKLQRALGHRSVSSTIAYIAFDDAEIDTAIQGLEI